MSINDDYTSSSSDESSCSSSAPTKDVNNNANQPISRNRDKILDICNELAVGIRFQVADFEISKFKSGFVSEIYRVTFRRRIPGFPDSLVVKLYNPDAPKEETGYEIINSQLNSLFIGKAGLGPRVHLVRPDALVLEFIASEQCLNKALDADLCLREDVARKLARFHALSVPVARNDHSEKLRQLFEVWCSLELVDSVYSGALRSYFETLSPMSHFLNTSFKTECDFVHNLIRKLDAEEPVIVFSHCDFNHLNLLVAENPETQKQEVKFIDFDFSSYFYRGADLGRFFVDCAQDDQFHAEDLISDNEMLQFLEWYREESARLNSDSDETNSLAQLLSETKRFALYAYMVDIIFCIYIADEAERELRKNPADAALPEKIQEFVGRADRRFGGYLRIKTRFLQDGSIP